MHKFERQVPFRDSYFRSNWQFFVVDIERCTPGSKMINFRSGVLQFVALQYKWKLNCNFLSTPFSECHRLLSFSNVLAAKRNPRRVYRHAQSCRSNASADCEFGRATPQGKFYRNKFMFPFNLETSDRALCLVSSWTYRKACSAHTSRCWPSRTDPLPSGTISILSLASDRSLQRKQPYLKKS